MSVNAGLNVGVSPPYCWFSLNVWIPWASICVYEGLYQIAVSSAVIYACITSPFWIGAMVSYKLSGYFHLQATAGEYVVSTQKLLSPTLGKVRRLCLRWEWNATITHQHPLHSQVEIHFTFARHFYGIPIPLLRSLPSNKLSLKRYTKSLTWRKTCQYFTWKEEKRARVPKAVLQWINKTELWPMSSLCLPPTNLP